MAIGGFAELRWGVSAEQKQLEDVAEPLSAEGEGGEGESEGGEAREGEEATRPLPRAPTRSRAERRFRLGPGSISNSRSMSVGGPYPPVPLDREVGLIEKALREHGSANGRELRQRVRARYWGPGRFRAALPAAIAAGRVKPLPRGQFAPVDAPRGDG